MKKKIISVILTVVICLGTFASLFTVQAATPSWISKYISFLANKTFLTSSKYGDFYYANNYEFCIHNISDTSVPQLLIHSGANGEAGSYYNVFDIVDGNVKFLGKAGSRLGNFDVINDKKFEKGLIWENGHMGYYYAEYYTVKNHKLNCETVYEVCDQYEYDWYRPVYYDIIHLDWYENMNLYVTEKTTNQELYEATLKSKRMLPNSSLNEAHNIGWDAVFLKFGYTMDGQETYPDVPANAWFFDAVKFASEKGCFSGYSNGKFGPADNISRQDFVVVLARIDGVNLNSYNRSSKLRDVKTGQYYTAAVNWAVDNNIVTGYNDGRFGIGDSMTREQLVTMLYRYAGYKHYSVVATDTKAKKYSDYNKVSDFAKKSIAWAIDKGVINGMDSAHIGPQGNASRAQVAQILKNISDKNILPF